MLPLCPRIFARGKHENLIVSSSSNACRKQTLLAPETPGKDVRGFIVDFFQKSYSRAAPAINTRSEPIVLSDSRSTGRIPRSR